MFQQRDFHDFCTLSYNPSKTMQIYENSTLKTIVLSIIFIKFFTFPLPFIHPIFSTPNQSVKTLQSYKVTELQNYKATF